jgi:hypothetical protein
VYFWVINTPRAHCWRVSRSPHTFSSIFLLQFFTLSHTTLILRGRVDAIHGCCCCCFLALSFFLSRSHTLESRALVNIYFLAITSLHLFSLERHCLMLTAIRVVHYTLRLFAKCKQNGNQISAMYASLSDVARDSLRVIVHAICHPRIFFSHCY